VNGYSSEALSGGGERTLSWEALNNSLYGGPGQVKGGPRLVRNDTKKQVE